MRQHTTRNGRTFYYYEPGDLEFLNFKKDVESYNSGEPNKLLDLITRAEEGYPNIEMSRYRGIYIAVFWKVRNCKILNLTDKQLLLFLGMVERCKQRLILEMYGLGSSPA